MKRSDPEEQSEAQPCSDERDGEAERPEQSKGTFVAQYLPILAMIVLVVLFVSLSFTASKLLGPRRPTSAKQAPYECGIVPEHEPAERFPVKFYLVAMAFIVLDVEIIFLYPFTTILRGLGTYGLIAMGTFLIVLLVPFGYLLSTGAIDWGPARRVATRVAGRALHATGTPGREGLELGATDESKKVA